MSTESPVVTVLERLMRERGLSPHALSLAAGLRRDAVRSIMVGRSKRPGADIISALARTLELPIDVLLGRAPIPAKAMSPMVSVDEFDLSPVEGGKPEPRDGRAALATWQIPSAACGGRLGPVIMVSTHGVDGEGNADGPRYLIDVSARGRLLSPMGDTWITWDGVGHVPAVLLSAGGGNPGAATWRLGRLDGLSGLLPIGRVLARWEIAG